MSSNQRITGLNQWVRSSKLRVTSSKLRVTSSNLRVASSNQGVQESFHQGKLKKIALKFPYFAKSSVLNRSTIREATHTVGVCMDL